MSYAYNKHKKTRRKSKPKERSRSRDETKSSGHTGSKFPSTPSSEAYRGAHHSRRIIRVGTTALPAAVCPVGHCRAAIYPIGDLGAHVRRHDAVFLPQRREGAKFECEVAEISNVEPRTDAPIRRAGRPPNSRFGSITPQYVQHVAFKKRG